MILLKNINSTFRCKLRIFQLIILCFEILKKEYQLFILYSILIDSQIVISNTDNLYIAVLAMNEACNR